MKGICLLLMMSLTVLSGCSESSALIKADSNGMRSDIFQESSNGAPVPQGYADLRIFSSLKTHKPGIYPFENKPHGTPEYRMLVNVDGQSLQLPGDLQKENTVPDALRDPEAGDGIRYRFSTKIRLKAGTHKVVVALPGDDIVMEREINLSGQDDNRLVVAPRYGASPGKKRPGFYGVTSFNEGLQGVRLILNGQDL